MHVLLLVIIVFSLTNIGLYTLWWPTIGCYSYMLGVFHTSI
jgi:hypothetical protein